MKRLAVAVSVAMLSLVSSGSILGAQTGPGSMSGMDMPKPASTLSSSLTVTVDGKTTKFSVAKLKAMPQQTVQVHNEHTKTDEQYSGPALSDVLAKCGFVADKATQKKMLHSYVVAGGTDKY
jgi:hypothetical protein